MNEFMASVIATLRWEKCSQILHITYIYYVHIITFLDAANQRLKKKNYPSSRSEQNELLLIHRGICWNDLKKYNSPQLTAFCV